MYTKNRHSSILDSANPANRSFRKKYGFGNASQERPVPGGRFSMTQSLGWHPSETRYRNRTSGPLSFPNWFPDAFKSRRIEKIGGIDSCRPPPRWIPTSEARDGPASSVSARVHASPQRFSSRSVFASISAPTVETLWTYNLTDFCSGLPRASTPSQGPRKFRLVSFQTQERESPSPRWIPSSEASGGLSSPSPRG